MNCKDVPFRRHEATVPPKRGRHNSQRAQLLSAVTRAVGTGRYMLVNYDPSPPRVRAYSYVWLFPPLNHCRPPHPQGLRVYFVSDELIVCHLFARIPRGTAVPSPVPNLSCRPTCGLRPEPEYPMGLNDFRRAQALRTCVPSHSRTACHKIFRLDSRSMVIQYNTLSQSYSWPALTIIRTGTKYKFSIIQGHSYINRHCPFRDSPCCWIVTS